MRWSCSETPPARSAFVVEQQPCMPNTPKRPLVLRTANKFCTRARLLVRLHDRNHRMEANIHIDRSGAPGPAAPRWGPGPHSQLTPCCLLQGPAEDARVRAECQQWRQERDLRGDSWCPQRSISIPGGCRLQQPPSASSLCPTASANSTF